MPAVYPRLPPLISEDRLQLQRCASERGSVFGMQHKTIPRSSQPRFLTPINIKATHAHFGRHLLRWRLQSPSTLHWPRIMARGNHLVQALMRMFEVRRACHKNAIHHVKLDQVSSPLPLSWGAFIVSVWMSRGLPQLSELRRILFRQSLGFGQLRACLCQVLL